MIHYNLQISKIMFFVNRIIVGTDFQLFCLSVTIQSNQNIINLLFQSKNTNKFGLKMKYTVVIKCIT